jgi:tetratricopeptide (TPR) repeat protein
MRPPACAAALLLGALLLAAAAAAAPPDARTLERYAQAARDYPDDPDVALAHALALRDAGLTEQALGRLRAIAKRWPALQARAGLEIGRLLYERGEPAQALESLEVALGEPRVRGAARLYRALCLLELGERESAERELRELERSDPDLKSSALLLRGVGEAERGELEAARALLRRAVEVDPSAPASEAAREALGRLPGSGRLGEPRLAAWVLAGAELDSNATLDSGTAIAGIPSDQSDARAAWSLGVLWQPLHGSRQTLALGYVYSENAHEDLKFYDQRSQVLFGSWSLGGRRAALRVDALVSDDRLDGERYARTWLLRPNVLLASDSALGVTRLFAELERREYHDEPVVPSLDRSGATTSVGLEQRAQLAWLRGATGSVELKVGQVRTEASRDLLGFRGDYDGHRARAQTQLQIPLPWRLDALVRGRLARERFAHTNLIDALTDEGVGRVDPRRRRDTTGDLTLALGWSASPRLRLELRWQGLRQRSNVDLYDYERHLLGLYALGQQLWW